MSTQMLPPGDIYPALGRDVIDATELSMPVIDLDLDFDQLAKHDYFAGWHQPSTLVDSIVNWSVGAS